MDQVIERFIKKVTMSASGCKHIDDCVHCYKEFRLGDQFIKGMFCIRFENWPSEIKDQICKQEDFCSAYRSRNNVDNVYNEAILEYREFSPGVLDLDKIFGG
jgi:hypothetical protein